MKNLILYSLTCVMIMSCVYTKTSFKKEQVYYHNAASEEYVKHHKDEDINYSVYGIIIITWTETRIKKCDCYRTVYDRDHEKIVQAIQYNIKYDNYRNAYREELDINSDRKLVASLKNIIKESYRQ